MFMVILMHTILNFTLRPDFFATKIYFLFEPIVALSKTCVLLFFMLSGFLVVSKKRSIQENIKKTLNKIVLPLSFFTLVNIGYAWTKFEYTGENLNEFILSQVQRMASFPSSPMWFLVVLAFLYFLNPIWQLVFDKKQKPDLARTLTGATLAFSIILTIAQFPAGRIDIMFNSFTAWTGFVFFYLYGALVRNKWIVYWNQKRNGILIVGGVLLTVLGDFLTMWQKTHNVPFIWNDYTGNYLSIPVTMTAVGIFNFLMTADLSKHTSRLLVWLAGASFGVYLIHTYIISVFTDIIGFDFNKLNMNVYVYNALNVFLVFSLSLLLTVCIRKIPKVKAIIGG